jgi:methylmalonyl-CoA mutase
METMFQRSQIQEESLYYENLKNKGDLPIVGVNTFLSPEGSPTTLPGEVIRATEDEKEQQIKTIQNLHKVYEAEAAEALQQLRRSAINNENIFNALMEAARFCSLGQITDTLFEVGGQYRRNM